MICHWACVIIITSDCYHIWACCSNCGTSCLWRNVLTEWWRRVHIEAHILTERWKVSRIHTVFYVWTVWRSIWIISSTFLRWWITTAATTTTTILVTWTIAKIPSPFIFPTFNYQVKKKIPCILFQFEI